SGRPPQTLQGGQSKRHWRFHRNDQPGIAQGPTGYPRLRNQPRRDHQAASADRRCRPRLAWRHGPDDGELQRPLGLKSSDALSRPKLELLLVYWNGLPTRGDRRVARYWRMLRPKQKGHPHEPKPVPSASAAEPDRRRPSFAPGRLAEDRPG